MTHDRQKLIEVVDYYSDQICQKPDHIPFYVFRSACYESLKEYSSALKDALEIIKLNPFYWKGNHQALKMHMCLGDIKQAELIAQGFKNDISFKPLISELQTMKQAHEKAVSAARGNNEKISSS